MSDPTLATTFKDHFAFLCTTDDDRARLQALASRVEFIEKKDDGALIFSIEGESVECAPPFTGPLHESTPTSYGELASHHNGIFWESMGGGDLGYFGLSEQGQTQGFISFDPGYLEDGDCDDVLEALAAAEISPDDLQEAFACGQNWILFDPLRQNARQEPALAFISHEGGGWQPIESADNLSAGAFTLALLAYYFLDDESLEEIYT